MRLDRVKRNKAVVLIVGFIFIFMGWPTFAWEIDFTRRVGPPATKASNPLHSPSQSSGSISKTSPKLLENVFKNSEPVQDIVILNTEKGFIPETLRLKKDGHYKITLVNVNEKERNVSFILDAFSESHATYFGHIKTFELSPKTDGIFSFICPETEAKGRVVIYSATSDKSRAPAGE